jgi:hypothetical protein
MKSQFILEGDVTKWPTRRLKDEIKKGMEHQVLTPQKGDTILKITYICNTREKGVSLYQLAEPVIKALKGSAFNPRNQICEQQVVRKVVKENPRTIIEVEVI